MRRLAIVMFCTVALLGCVSTSTMATNDADAYIRSAIPRFITAFNAGDLETMAGFYSDDAVVLPPNADIARGPAAIQQAFGMIMPMIPVLNFSPDRIVQSCDVAYEYGRYQMRLTPPGAAAMTDSGKYATVWRRMPNGDWKIVVDMFNTSLPAPGM